ncbi:cytochrome P450 [Macrophomina phaseolina]|uniref:Cytochrome P450 n=1 Tax=Macrophomina phaseolina TaxID=35725 RepID=A0ABQ8GEH1_9PEZI|nr:cytochrome P450 [Macrophomina phaseolina]
MQTTKSQTPVFFGPSMAFGAVIFTILTYLIHKILKIGSRPKGFPPGPPTRPFYGNLKEISTLRPHLTYAAWSQTYGPIYTIMRGPDPWLVINSAATAHDIFNKQGQVTAGRPNMRLDIACRGGYAPAAQSGASWRAARKMWHAVLNVGASRAYLPYQELEAEKLVVDVCEDGDAWRTHVERFSNSVAMTMTNGRRTPAAGDPRVREVMDDLWEISVCALRWAWLDGVAIAWSRWVPAWMVPGRREAKGFTERHEKMLWRLWNSAFKSPEGAEVVLPSFNKAVQEKLRAGYQGITEREGTEVTHSLLQAATDTTASTLNIWVAAMAMFPEVQKKAQEEIDRVVGPNRLPSESDAANLPYTRQCIQELQRWISVAPLALPHATTAPMQIGEYHIPAGTGLILNTHAIHRDPVAYPEPREFRPERWEGKLQMVTSDEQVGARTELFSFGAGRRICPGQHLAERNLFYVCSHLLWAVDIRKKKDAAGKDIEIDMDDVRPGLVNTMNPFEADVKPRSTEKSVWAKRNWEQKRSALLDSEEQWIQSPEVVESVMARAAR